MTIKTFREQVNKRYHTITICQAAHAKHTFVASFCVQPSLWHKLLEWLFLTNCRYTQRKQIVSEAEDLNSKFLERGRGGHAPRAPQQACMLTHVLACSHATIILLPSCFPPQLKILYETLEPQHFDGTYLCLVTCKIKYGTTIITLLKFKISWGGEGGERREEIPGPPPNLYACKPVTQRTYNCTMCLTVHIRLGLP